jgi:hypothetical protein
MAREGSAPRGILSGSVNRSGTMFASGCADHAVRVWSITHSALAQNLGPYELKAFLLILLLASSGGIRRLTYTAGPPQHHQWRAVGALARRPPLVCARRLGPHLALRQRGVARGTCGRECASGSA